MDKLPTLESFLEDISPSLPTGESLRYDTLYDDVREAQRADDDLPQGVWVQELKVSDWARVEELCVAALQRQTKDIQLCAWLMESWMFLHGLQGLCHGFDVLDQLSKKYWDAAYPEIGEDGDLGFRLSPYVWMNEKLSERLRLLSITDAGDMPPINFAQYLDIKVYWGPGADAPPAGEKADLLKAFEQGVVKTNPDFFQNLKTHCLALSQAVKDLETFLDEKCKEEAPTLQRLRQVLEDLESFGAHALAWKGRTEKPQTPQEESKEALDDQKTPVPVSEEPTDGFDISSVIRSREEAYQVIRQAADYLERLDPHSPAPHMVKRAVAWGNMPLKNLLEEVIKEPQALKDVQTLLGLGDGQTPTTLHENEETVDKTSLPQQWLDPTKSQV